MREIKFRCWDIKRKAFVDDSEFAVCANGDFIDRNDNGITDDIWHYIYDHENFIVIQYTGLKDKNQEDIYEGDIIRFIVYEPDATYFWDSEVKFEEGSFIMFGSSYSLFQEENEGEIEIIGNIFENPELLEIHNNKNQNNKEKNHATTI